MMKVRDALTTLAEARQPDQVVVTNQGSARIWPRIKKHPLDFHYNPSTMGGAIPLALGLALAQPAREIIVVSGDGALLMNLGSIVSVIAAKCRTFTVIVLDNGLYEVTGGQRTPAADTQIDFSAVARGVGFPVVANFDAIDPWCEEVAGLFTQIGPRFISLKVSPADTVDLTTVAEPMSDQLARFQQAIM